MPHLWAEFSFHKLNVFAKSSSHLAWINPSWFEFKTSHSDLDVWDFSTSHFDICMYIDQSLKNWDLKSPKNASKKVWLKGAKQNKRVYVLCVGIPIRYLIFFEYLTEYL